MTENVDMIAASFIRRAANIDEVRNLPGVRDNNIMIIAKIESQEGVDNLEEICEAVDGIMVRPPPFLFVYFVLRCCC